MKRIADKALHDWLNSPRRKPMVLRGARQVGKSTLVRQFAGHQGLKLNEINLERHLYLEKIFGSLDMMTIRNELEALVGRSITSPNSLLFLDEIQAVPSALQALRYFYEELPQVPLIAAGSLLEFALAKNKLSMPVGRVVYQFLGPMTFHEFLEAVEPNLCLYLAGFCFDTPLPESAHLKLIEQLRKFLVIGGMPEAVLAFKESNSIEESFTVQTSIANTYEDDFAKYARQKDLSLLQRVFRQIPRMVGEKVKLVNFSREERAREVRASIELLAKAHICCPVYASHCSGVPLYADINESVFKLIFLDVGLMNHICGADWLTFSRLDEAELVNKGAVAEQFIGQHLAWAPDGTAPPKPVYWLRENRAANAEVDYVASHGTAVFPIEVKSGKSGSLRSLHQFAAAKPFHSAVRFDLNQPSTQDISREIAVGHTKKPVRFKLRSLPLYAIGELDRLLGDLRKTA